MAQSVFLSYARESASDAATKLYDALGGPEGLAFCDISDIEAGECLPESLSNALLNSTVVVVFADSTYFTRWYCLRELRMALGPFEAALRDRTISEKLGQDALRHIVLRLLQMARKPERN